MSNNITMNDDLLVKYMTGETTPDESIQVEEWVSTSDSNRKYFAQLQKIWEETEATNTGADVQNAWKGLEQRIKASSAPAAIRNEPQPVKERDAVALNTYEIPATPKRRKFGWVAALVILLIVATAGYYAWNYYGILARPVKLFSGNVVLLDTLPDGSIVTLNSRTKLSYPEKFKGSSRKVTLDGEAYFKTSSNALKSFVVSAGDVMIKSTGSTFNVNSRNGRTEVAVSEGSVNVAKGNTSTDLRAGEIVEVNKGSDRFVTSTPKSKLYGYYATGELVCVQTPLNELVATLNDIYHENIIIQNPTLQQLPITTTFKNKSLDQILFILIEQYNVTADNINSQIVLK